MIIGIDIAYTSYKIKDRASKISLWMTTLSGHKSAQALTGEEKTRQTDQINEYDFFVSTSGLESNEALTKEDVNKTGSEKGALNPDQSASFFLPD
jgi:DeoR/GlpR family transcriptional regulator of sugar metabolism